MSNQLDKKRRILSNRLDKTRLFLSNRLNKMDKQTLKSVMLDNQNKERETDALIKLSKVLTCKRFFIITFDEEGILQTNNNIEIEVIPIWKWLLKNIQ